MDAVKETRSDRLGVGIVESSEASAAVIVVRRRQSGVLTPE